MLALVTMPGHAHTTRVTEVPDAAAGPHEVLLRPLRVGVCGTDREISDGRFGVAPDSEQHLILGHELLARVEADGHGFARGDLVCATCAARAATSGVRAGFARCVPYRERGIMRLHGFAAERVAEAPEQLIPVSEGLGALAVLAELASIRARGLRHADAIAGRQRRRALVLGAGAIGTLGTSPVNARFALRSQAVHAGALDRSTMK